MLHQQTQEETHDTSVLPNAESMHDMPLPMSGTQISEGEAGGQTQSELELPFSAPSSSSETRKYSLPIKRLRRKLSRRSFLPQMDAYWENPGPLSAEKFRAALAALRNPAPNSWRERMLCAWLLGHAPLTPEQKIQAAGELGKVIRNRHAPRGEQIRAHLQTTAMWTLPCTVLGASAITLHLIVTSLINRPIELGISLFMGLCLIMFFVFLLPVFCIVFGLFSLLVVKRTNHVRSAALLALGRLQVPEAVGSLARTTLDVSPGIRSVAEESLRQCLPQLTPEHYARLDADTVPALCRLLDVKKERLFAYHAHTEQLVLAVLDALGKIGDGSAVRHVESVAEDGWTQSVRDAAQAILPLLRERRQQENNPRLLLRGSAPPLTGSDQLLRATLPTPNALPEHLLRPINTPTMEIIEEGSI